MSFAQRDGTKLYWTEAGAGDPLLLIMGLGATHELWHRLTPVVAAHFRTILFDNRGAGRSDVPPAPYSIAEMADDAVAVLDAAGAPTAHIFGASMGGMIAQEVALRHPERVRSLILGCTACGGREAIPARREVLAALDSRETMTREEAIRVMVPYIHDTGTPAALIEEDIAVRLGTTVSNDGYVAQLQAVRSWKGTYARLPGIDMPTLIIHGETDQLIPAANAPVLARAIPNAILVMLPHASHIFLTDQTKASCEAILSFLGSRVAV